MVGLSFPEERNPSSEATFEKGCWDWDIGDDRNAFPLASGRHHHSGKAGKRECEAENPALGKAQKDLLAT